MKAASPLRQPAARATPTLRLRPGIIRLLLRLTLWIAVAGWWPHAAAAAAAVGAQHQRVTLALAAEPPSLNSLLATDSVSFFVLAHVMEGLTRYGPDGTLEPAVAERWELREDGATFWLRRDARWSDGVPVTAHDFVFAWREALRPATGSQYAFILYPIANAEAINRGNMAVERLGVEAAGDHRLEVRFERPCPYFVSLTAFMTYLPLREAFFRERGGRYAADASDLLYNGPFTLAHWVHGARLILKRNPHYWERQAIRLSEIDIAYITADLSTTYNLFKDGAVALAQLEAETLADALDQGYPIRQLDSGALSYLSFNFREGRVTANRELRRAIQAIFDPSVLVNKVIGMPGNRPAVSLFPRAVRGAKGRLRDEHPPAPVARSLARAHTYLAEARRQLRLETLPPLVLLAGDSPQAAKEAEFFQALLGQGLGLDIRIDKQVFRQRLEKMSRGEFDIVAANWAPDFDDPITFGDLFASWNENNRGGYRSNEYDRWVRAAMATTDPVARARAMAQLQRIIQQDVPILPTYERGLVYVQHPRLKGVVRNIFGGDPNLRDAWVE